MHKHHSCCIVDGWGRFFFFGCYCCWLNLCVFVICLKASSICLQSEAWQRAEKIALELRDTRHVKILWINICQIRARYMENGTLDVAMFTFNEIYENQIIVLNVNIFYRKIYIQLDFRIRWMAKPCHLIQLNIIFSCEDAAHLWSVVAFGRCYFVGNVLDKFSARETVLLFVLNRIELIHDTKWTESERTSILS